MMRSPTIDALRPNRLALYALTCQRTGCRDTHDQLDNHLYLVEQKLSKIQTHPSLSCLPMPDQVVPKGNRLTSVSPSLGHGDRAPTQLKMKTWISSCPTRSYIMR